MSCVFGAAGMQFSERHNALYGLGDFVSVLTEMCARNATAGRTVGARMRAQDLPTARWFLGKARTIGEDGADALCGRLIEESIARSGVRGRTRLLGAVDKHLIPRYDRDNMVKLIFSKFKRGTSKFEAYITLQIVGDGAAKVVLDCRRVTRGDFNRVFMREFMKTLQKYRIGLARPAHGPRVLLGRRGARLF